MSIIGFIILTTIIISCGYFYLVAKHVSQKIKTVPDFLSYGTDISEASLERTFEGSNASFLTSFVSIFFMSFFLGINTIWLPIGFILGIILFNYVFLPRLAKYFFEDYRTPEFVTNDFSGRGIRVFVGVFSIINLYLFTFTEIQGFHYFVCFFFDKEGLIQILIPVIVVSIVAIYTSIGGYKAVISTDKIQVWLIRIGALTLLGFIVVTFFTSDIGLATRISNLPTPTIDINFAIATIIGFLFSQLMYYDNWQRLSFYIVQKSQKEAWKKEEVEEKLADIIRKIRKSYNFGALILFLLYSLPILLGFLMFSNNPHFDFSSFSAPALLAYFFKSIMPSGFSFLNVLYIIFMAVISLFFFATLITTTDTYILGSVNILSEDIFQLFKRQERYHETSTKKLEIIQLITLLFSLSFLLFVFYEPDFERIYLFMFFSVNGIAGPLFWKTMGRKLNKYSFIVSLLFCFIYTYLNIFAGFLKDNNCFVFNAGFFTLFASLVISFIGTRKE